MGKSITIALYVAAMAVVVIGIDVAFFRGRFWERLSVNIGLIFVFGAFYFRFLGHIARSR
jgi:type IV secretory pathway VirB2 component (pilin)